MLLASEGGSVILNDHQRNSIPIRFQPVFILLVHVQPFQQVFTDLLFESGSISWLGVGSVFLVSCVFNAFGMTISVSYFF